MMNEWIKDTNKGEGVLTFEGKDCGKEKGEKIKRRCGNKARIGE